MLQALLSRINDRYSERRQVLVSDFETLVANVISADAEEMDADQIAAVLESIGRTVDDLAAAAELVVTYYEYASFINEAGLSERCKLPSLSITAGELRSETERFRERIELLKTIKEQPRCAEELEALAKETETERQRFTKAQQRWQEKNRELTQASKRLESKLSTIDLAIRKLFKVRVPTARERELLQEREAASRSQPDYFATFGKPSAGIAANITRLMEDIAAEQASQMEPATAPILPTVES
jgi:DNA repair exonuclease SbcCD ATPase subunit